MPSVLIIDDDRLVGEATKIVLQAKGFQVTLAGNGKAGIEAARTGRFDVAIVDLFMPDLNGLKVIETIRQSGKSIPMIVASGFMFGGDELPSMPDFDSMAQEAGAVATLYKPFRPDELVRVIEQALNGSA
ncbi:MAG TPA: response regulator [Pseudolabrys sp.]|nr:response regulator [Pseudolabrys sp.]